MVGSLTNEAIETPDMASTFTSSIPGNDKADNSSITFSEDRLSAQAANIRRLSTWSARPYATASCAVNTLSRSRSARRLSTE